jgi:GNAT superfamily N-acetyltransferase
VSARIEVQRLREDQIEAAADLMNLVFADLMGAISERPPPARTGVYRHGFLSVARFCYAHGEPLAAHIERKLVGLALWMPPNTTGITEEELREFSIDQIKDLFSDSLGHLYAVFDRLFELRKEQMKEPHWLTPPRIDVHPDYRGKGVASALLRPILLRADEGNIFCYADTTLEYMPPLLRKHGFRALKEGVEPTSNVYYWTLRREPNPK